MADILKEYMQAIRNREIDHNMQECPECKIPLQTDDINIEDNTAIENVSCSQCLRSYSNFYEYTSSIDNN